MESTPILYQDVVDGILAIAELTKAPTNKSTCYICSREYGSMGSGIEINLDLLSQLPGAFRKTFIEHTVEPVRTSCGHMFCIFCLGVWFKNESACTCPMCRHPLHLPYNLERENTDDGRPEVGIEGLSISLNVSTPLAAELYRIVRMETRELLLTSEEMPFKWNAEAMLHDLPVIMVSIARRFYYQSLKLQGSVPKDLFFMRRHSAVRHFIEWDNSHNLKFFERTDAPLAGHEHAFALYKILCERIKDLEAVMGDDVGRCSNWEGPARTLMYKVVHEYMPEADGGVGGARWRAYISCVIKVLFVWQAYCERAHMLIRSAQWPTLDDW